MLDFICIGSSTRQKIQNEKFLSTVGLEPTTLRFSRIPSNRLSYLGLNKALLLILPLYKGLIHRSLTMTLMRSGSVFGRALHNESKHRTSASFAICPILCVTRMSEVTIGNMQIQFKTERKKKG